MITARKILEEYEAARKMGGTYVEIFSNPSQDELSFFKGNNIRFIAVASSRKVYVADASKIIHDMMKKLLQLRIPSDSAVFSLSKHAEPCCSDWLEGLARKIGGTYRTYQSDLVGAMQLYATGDYSLASRKEEARDVLDELLDQNWSWADKYVQVTPYMRQVKR